METDPSTTTPNCSLTWLCSATMAPGSMTIQQVISASPITGWIWIPGAGENAGTSDRRTQVTLLAAPVFAPSSFPSPVPDIFPPLAQRDPGLSTGAAGSQHVRIHCRRCRDTDDAGRNKDERRPKFRTGVLDSPRLAS